MGQDDSLDAARALRRSVLGDAYVDAPDGRPQPDDGRVPGLPHLYGVGGLGPRGRAEHPRPESVGARDDGGPRTDGGVQAPRRRESTCRRDARRARRVAVPDRRVLRSARRPVGEAGAPGGAGRAGRADDRSSGLASSAWATWAASWPPTWSTRVSRSSATTLAGSEPTRPAPRSSPRSKSSPAGATSSCAACPTARRPSRWRATIARTDGPASRIRRRHVDDRSGGRPRHRRHPLGGRNRLRRRARVRWRRRCSGPHALGHVRRASRRVRGDRAGARRPERPAASRRRRCRAWRRHSSWRTTSSRRWRWPRPARRWPSARSVGLDMELMLEVLNASSGQSQATTDKFPNHVLTGRYAAGFANTLMAKDLRLYLEAAGAQRGTTGDDRRRHRLGLGALRRGGAGRRLHPDLPVPRRHLTLRGTAAVRRMAGRDARPPCRGRSVQCRPGVVPSRRQRSAPLAVERALSPAPEEGLRSAGAAGSLTLSATAC